MNSTPLRPMLATDSTPERLEELFKETSLFASFKLDGIRALYKDGKLLSRTLKPIPNQYTQAFFKDMPRLQGLDGELICGAPYGNDVYNRASSAFMSHGGEPDLTYWIFDIWEMNGQFSERYATLQAWQAYHFPHEVCLLEQRRIFSMKELEEYETEALERGYEGLILKDPRGHYKHGRSTLKQALMLKVKRFADSEAMICEVKELQRNHNPIHTDELGYAKRSTHKANKVGGGMMGKLECRDTKLNWTFEVGTGFDESQRQEIWNNRHQLIQRPHYIKYKYLPHGSQGAPRHPVFLGFRDPIDFQDPA